MSTTYCSTRRVIFESQREDHAQILSEIYLIDIMRQAKVILTFTESTTVSDFVIKELFIVSRLIMNYFNKLLKTLNTSFDHVTFRFKRLFKMAFKRHPRFQTLPLATLSRLTPGTSPIQRARGLEFH